MNDYYTQFDAAERAFDENTLADCDDKTLQEYLIAVAREDVLNPALQHRNIIRGITINHLLLQRHIDRLNKKNSITQQLVIALTVSALIIGIPQLWYSYRAHKRAEIEQTPSAKGSIQSESQTSSPILAQPQPQPKNPVSSAAGTASTTPQKP